MAWLLGLRNFNDIYCQFENVDKPSILNDLYDI